ncbi:MAG: tetratricopeptide repeat protein [Pyrinomonadaceae bacterium MAG19_C2-C3]|nr:tetratricopeptide repeat protein [Pyrinomonadaceae bacterium MAG19_C2-C3]
MRAMMTLVIVSLVIASSITSSVAATQAQVPREAASVVNDKRFIDVRKQGFDALYNLDYASARTAFRELDKTYPDHPAGAQFLAATLFLETLNRSRRLQSSLINDDNFYAEENDKVAPEIIREFRELTTRATNLAEARLKRNPKDTDALYFLGATRGLKASFAAGVERRFLAALREGDGAIDKHREVIKLDPKFHDAEVTIGLYDYIVGNLPLPVKLLASIGGFRGSKKRGLATLERVAREGTAANDDARVLLITLYRRERRPLEALTQARELSRRYPNNYLFKLEIADALMAHAALVPNEKPESAASTNNASTIDVLSATDARSEALTIFESLITNGKTSNALPLDLIHFKYGEALMQANEPTRAAEKFVRAATTRNAETALVTNAHLRAAQAFDLALNRPEAVKHYTKVLTLPNAYGAHDKAKRGLEAK